MRVDLDGVLSGRLPEDLRFLVIFGRSGTGKTTLLQHLAGAGGPLAGRPVHVLRPYHGGWGGVPGDVEWVAVDEVKRPADVLPCVRLVASGRRLLIASHVAPPAFALLRPWGRGRVLDLDSGEEHLARYLESSGIRFSRGALRQFVRQYGGSVTELKVVLEHSGGDNLDRALHLFSKQCSIRFLAPRRGSRTAAG
jgi:energy-coupling factor transporter ATP-binding protein EcfA2